MAKCRAMSSMLDPQPPALLQAFHARLSRRYGAPGVRLLDFPGRWMVFRSADLAAGLEHAVIDFEPSRHSTDEVLAELESRAEFAVGEGHDATLVVMHLGSRELPDHDPHAASSTLVLTITAWSLAHRLGVTGAIELDAAGTPVWIGEPYVVVRSASRGSY